MSTAGAELVFGGASWASVTDFEGTEKQKQGLATLTAAGIRIVDTAAMYADSEEILGQLGAAKTQAIDSKYPAGFGPEPSTKEGIIATAEKGLEKIKADSFDVYYIHAPDRRVPLETQLEAINELYQAGKIKRFGLSNYLPGEVEDVIRVAKEKNWVLPSVFQGNYSAVARHAETELFPILRQYGIQFYAYSPIAGGFLTKTVDQLLQGAQGRWDPSTFLGALYHRLYNKPSMLEGLKLWESISNDTGIPKVELAYRWVVYNSGLKREHGDKVVFGSRNLQQLEETLAAINKGPLGSDVVERIEEMWRLVEKDSPLDNFNQ
ncbi:NADP-dependent oxidoreductase domain-containing protein [Aspergillus pseudoustus]|uniref:NADP-dependent oxidoreductase domain-containing protein n=1 Tax=Aspergillus pseudoustus TaxID=1810923 RepID=A0ABR4KFR8_9EURO